MLMKPIIIDIDSNRTLIIKKENKVNRYSLYYGACFDGFGKKHQKMTYITSYDSYEELEADIGGLLLYIEYDEEDLTDDSNIPR